VFNISNGMTRVTKSQHMLLDETSET